MPQFLSACERLVRRADNCEILLGAQPEQLVFGSPPHPLDFADHSPLELLGVVFRLVACPFPQAGRYSVQFWYNEQKVEERALQLR